MPPWDVLQDERVAQVVGAPMHQQQHDRPGDVPLGRQQPAARQRHGVGGDEGQQRAHGGEDGGLRGGRAGVLCDGGAGVYLGLGRGLLQSHTHGQEGIADTWPIYSRCKRGAPQTPGR